MLKQTYKNKAKKVIAFGLLSTMCITSLGISQTNATATFSQTSVPQQSSNVANGEILTTTSFNSVVSDIGNLITDIDGLKTYIWDKYNDLKSYVDNLIANLQITSAEIVDGTIKKEDLDPNLDLGIWKKDASGNATYGSWNILVSEVGRPTNKWGLYLWGWGNMNITWPNPWSRLGLQRDVDDATVDVGNSANNNARFDVYGNATITKDLGFKGILKGWLASLNDYVTLFKGSVGNPTTWSQDIHFLPDMVKWGDKSWTNSVKFWFNSEIDNYSFYSKETWTNKNLFKINSDWKIYTIWDIHLAAPYIYGDNESTWLRLDALGSIHQFIDIDNDSTWNQFTWNTNKWSFNSPVKRLMTLDENWNLWITWNLWTFDADNRKILFSWDKWMKEDTSDWEILEIRQHTWQGKPWLKITDQDWAARFLYQMNSNNIWIYWDSDRAIFGLRHLGSNNNPIEIRTEDVNDDGIILTSRWHDVANFKKAGVTIDSSDISLKATWTDKWLRVKSDGSVCIWACW